MPRILLIIILFYNLLMLDRCHGAVDLSRKGQRVDFPRREYKSLEIFCFAGIQPNVAKYWASASFRVGIESNQYQLFFGANESHVQEQADSHKAAWLISPFRIINKEVSLNPFDGGCLGVLTAEQYTLTLDLFTVNLWQLCLTALGIFVLLNAAKMSRNTFFHYTTGVTLGVVFTFFILTYMVQRKLKSSWFSWILGAYSLSMYCVTSMWYNLREAILNGGQSYVMLYLVVVSFVSFAICYRLGPVQDGRTLDLIQWTMQAFAMLLIYSASYQRNITIGLICTLLTYMSIPAKYYHQLKVWYRVKFCQPEIRLLNEAEYLDQTRIATAKAIAELRSFCKSPECNTWTTVSRVQSPSRFAEFVNGASHITEDEILSYSQHDYSLYSDVDDSDANGDRNSEISSDNDSVESSVSNWPPGLCNGHAEGMTGKSLR